MSPVEWYFARGNKQSGPVSSVDLKRLADVGDLRPDDLVWREGLAEWVMARNVRGLFNENASPAVLEPAPAKAAEVEPKAEAVEPHVALAERRAPLRHVFDVLLDWLPSASSESLVNATAAVFRACGVYGLWVSIAVNLVLAVLAEVKADIQGSFILAVSDVVLLAALQYCSSKAFGLLERLGRRMEVTVSSAVLPDCVAILSLLAAVSAAVASIAAVDSSGYVAIPSAAAAAVVLAYLGLAAMRLGSVNVGVDDSVEQGLGDEALATVTFLVKCLIRTLPVAFGVGVISATLALGAGCYAMVVGGDALLDAVLIAAIARRALYFFAAMPLAAYLLVLLYGLLLDLCRAILAWRGPTGKLTSGDSVEK